MSGNPVWEPMRIVDMSDDTFDFDEALILILLLLLLHALPCNSVYMYFPLVLLLQLQLLVNYAKLRATYTKVHPSRSVTSCFSGRSPPPAAFAAA